MEMKKIIYIILGITLIACNSENANDCFQTTGDIVQQEKSVALFSKIRVNRGVELILKEGADHEVIVESGENLINDVEINVVNEQLIISDNNHCNFVRDYNVTKVYVTAPNLTEIISATQYRIESDGILNYSTLRLVSEDFSDSSGLAIGDIDLRLNAQSIITIGNNLTTFTLQGFTENLDVRLFSGDGRFFGGNLIANKVIIYHRGTNDLVVNPQNELIGELRSTGNLIAKNNPPIVDVQAFYTGILIFE